MEYTPESVRLMSVQETLPEALVSATDLVLVRRLKLVKFNRQRLGDFVRLDLLADGLSWPMSIPAGQEMSFGGERIRALEYLKRVLEFGDMVDAVVGPIREGGIPVKMFWIHIEYVGSPKDAGSFSRKEDGLFAMRAKAGEKAERVVAKLLRDDYGHVFTEGMCDTPGFFEIRYDKTKRQRKPDRKCLACGLSFEVKKRNRDEYFRVSHSRSRPFDDENGLKGWHAFVFPDMKVKFVRNIAIAEAVRNGCFTEGSDSYDTWADIDPEAISVSEPPMCVMSQSS